MKNGTPFEEAYERLEKILEKMHSEQVPLEEALGLYEEADTLISACQKRLQEAEQKIEILVKKREGTLTTDPSGEPVTEPFETPEHSSLNPGY